MRVTYRREMKVEAEMDALGVQAFVPMRRILQKGRRLKTAFEPAIHNLIFIHAPEEKVQALKKTRPELQYMMRQMNGRGKKKRRMRMPPGMEGFDMNGMGGF